MIKEATQTLAKGDNLTAIQMTAVMEEIMSGKLTTPEIVSFLIELNQQGETPEELAAAVEVMRRYAVRVKTKHKVILDTCGTGGDKKHTFNISTAVAFVVSGAGIAVAKHGNRSVSSKVGSADVLEELGININMPKETIEKCLDEIGIAFLFAQNFHPAMKYVMPARKEIAAKTIFNFLGPLSNPAGATHQLIGVYDSKWAEILAYALQKLNIEHALVVHGEDGLDELSTLTKTIVYEIDKQEVRYDEVSYADFGIKKAQLKDLSGGNAKDNARILLDILNNKPTAAYDIVLLNAAAAIYAASAKQGSIKEGIKKGLELAEKSLSSGKALEKLELLKKYGQG